MEDIDHGYVTNGYKIEISHSRVNFEITFSASGTDRTPLKAKMRTMKHNAQIVMINMELDLNFYLVLLTSHGVLVSEKRWQNMTFLRVRKQYLFLAWT